MGRLRAQPGRRCRMRSRRAHLVVEKARRRFAHDVVVIAVAPVVQKLALLRRASFMGLAGGPETVMR